METAGQWVSPGGEHGGEALRCLLGPGLSQGFHLALVLWEALPYS